MTSAVQRIELPRPDDWHLHLRDGAVLRDLVRHTAARFGRAIVMPNLKPPVTTVEQALAYRERILAALEPGAVFEPLMTLYLTPATTVADVAAAAASPYVHAFKLYPAGATTNAEHGVRDLGGLDHVLAALAEHDVPLLVHGESIDPEVDVFDREAVFVEQTLAPLVARHAGLRVVLEHVSTAEAVEWVRSAPSTVAATITAHHLLYDRNAMFEGGVRPHMYCLPVLKRARHRQALVSAATSGDPKFFLGTDSAPHERATKEASCGCAGVFTAHAGIELYAEAFAQAGALDRLADFASRYGPRFYRLPIATDTVVLEASPWRVPDVLPLGAGHLVPLRAGQDIAWRLVDPRRRLTPG